MRPHADRPMLTASFLEEDSNGWLVTFSDLVLQLFAFVLVAAVLGTGAVGRAPTVTPAPVRVGPRPATPPADALSLARFDELPARAPADVRAEPVREVPIAVAPAPPIAAPVAAPPVRSLASELDAFITSAGLADVVQVAVNGGGVTLSLSETIGFASGSAELLPDAAPVLAEVRGLVGTRTDLVVEVSGHTDDRALHAGAFRSNLDLSLARAARVAHELAADDPDLTARIFAAGYGSARPIAANDDPEGRARNRRVELRLIPAADAVPSVRAR